SRGQLHAALWAGLDLDDIGQIDGVHILGDGNDFEGGGGSEGGQRERKTYRECKEVTHQGRLYPAVGFIVAARLRIARATRFLLWRAPPRGTNLGSEV